MKKRIALALSLIFVAGLGMATEPEIKLSLAATVDAAITESAAPPADSAVKAVAGEALPPNLPPIEVRDAPRPPAAIDLTNPPDDLWIRVRNGFAMPNLSNEVVLHHQAWYLNRPDLVRRIVERSGRYLYYIVDELEKRGMPMELALLPMIESSYNPMALSPARASGLWQFIPSTGRTYKLEQNAWIDERRDIVASTGAALDYLQTIYDMNGDWHLALASYNWGENAVARAIARNKARGLPTDYLSLAMPAETRNYVPKLQALKNILSNPKLFAALDLPTFPNKPYFSTVPKPANIDIKVAARLAEMPVNEFVALNPANNRPLIKEQQHLVLPADKVDVFNVNLENHNAPLSLWQAYTLKPGDRLEQIAARNGMSVAQLKHANGIGRKMKVGPGTGLLIPSSREALADLAAMPRVPTEAPAAAKKVAKHKGGTATLAKAKSRKLAKAGKPGRERITIAGSSGKAKIALGHARKKAPVRLAQE